MISFIVIQVVFRRSNLYKYFSECDRISFSLFKKYILRLIEERWLRLGCMWMVISFIVPQAITPDICWMLAAPMNDSSFPSLSSVMSHNYQSVSCIINWTERGRFSWKPEWRQLTFKYVLINNELSPKFNSRHIRGGDNKSWLC